MENGVRFPCQYDLIHWTDNEDTQLGLKGHILKREKIAKYIDVKDLARI